jgi:hypothetical protein
MNNRRLVLRKDGIRIDLFGRPESRGLVATFTGLWNRDLDGGGFGGDFLLKNGYSVLAFKSARDDWWQSLSTEEVTAISTDVGPVRATYGSSAGGYAAIYFAKTLSATRAVALSPQFDVRQDWDKRWADYASRFEWRHDIESPTISPPSAVLFFDPYDVDKLHVDRLVAAHPTTDWRCYRLPFAGHPVGHVMQVADILGDAILDSIQGRPVSICRGSLRAARRGSFPYFHALAFAAYQRRRNGLALKLVQRALTLHPAHPDATNLLRHIEGAHQLGATI